MAIDLSFIYIQMEKLIELLNEYWTQKQANANWKEFLEEEKNQIYLIFWMDFIKWLVENDKIDTESYCRITSIERKWEKDVYRDEVDSLLMLLAIQDEPIRFLCDILK